MLPNRNFRIGRLNFNLGTKQEVVAFIDSLPSNTDDSRYFIFWGGPMTVDAYTNVKFQEVEKKATLCLADGQSIIYVAKRSGMKNIERCAGPDIMDLILRNGLLKNKTHYFYGATEDTLIKLKIELENKYPGINIVGTYSPPFRDLTEQEDKEIISTINSIRPDYIWVALGAPKQEIWCMDHCKYIKGANIFAVGAAFNFYAGTVKRAPLWIQKFGFEWLYRICKEPRHLWKRYFFSAFKFVKLAKNNVEVLEKR